MDKVFIAIKDKIAELNDEITRLLRSVIDGNGGDKDLKEVKRKRQLLQDVLSILEGHNIIY